MEEYIIGMIIGVIIGLTIQAIVATYFSAIAVSKGYESGKYWHISFWLGLAGWLIVVALPDRSAKYLAAVELLAGEEYTAAGNLFAELDDYLDSREKCKLAQSKQYQHAVDCLKNKDFYTAMDLFKDLKDYRDSKKYYEVAKQYFYRAYTGAYQCKTESGEIASIESYIYTTEGETLWKCETLTQSPFRFTFFDYYGSPDQKPKVFALEPTKIQHKKIVAVDGNYLLTIQLIEKQQMEFQIIHRDTKEQMAKGILYKKRNADAQDQ